VGELVQLIAVTHNPLLPRLFQRQGVDARILSIREGFEQMRTKLAEAEPNVLLCVGCDHLNQWFMDNMPAFLIGKAPEACGPFEHEVQDFGVPRYRAQVHMEAAKAIVAAGFSVGVDFGFSDEFTMDHSFALPLAYIRPEADLPIIPLFANVMAPPVPPPVRFYQVGRALRTIVQNYLPADLRVGVIASGHMSTEIGGPRASQASVDPEFDAQMTQLMATGDVETLLRELSWDRLMKAGNTTYAFVAYLLVLGMADGRPASQATTILSSTNAAPFWTWDLHKEAGAA
jgi:aromatic ring-opening dioxygenase catalytic subunit (LigB family)